MSNNDDGRAVADKPEPRFYARPRAGESDGEFTERFKEGILGMIAAYRREHPEYFEDEGREPGDPGD